METKTQSRQFQTNLYNIFNNIFDTERKLKLRLIYVIEFINFVLFWR